MTRHWYDPKVCPLCRKRLTRGDFGPSASTSDGKQVHCQACTSKRKAQRVSARYRQTKEGRITTILGGLRYRTRKASRRLDITRKEIGKLLRKRKCTYCGCSLSKETRTLDHVRPLAKGGDTTAANLVAACATCNREKSDQTIEEWTQRWYK